MSQISLAHSANITRFAHSTCPQGQTSRTTRTSLAAQTSLARKGKLLLPARANITQKTESSQRLLSVFCGAAGRTRTGTLLRAADFESATSANFVTAANCVYFIAFLRKICNNIRIGRLERRQICFPISK